MEDEEQAARKALSAPFPDPPHFYEHFTASNLALLDSTLNQKDVISNPSQELALPLAENLQLLRPPTPPVDGTYHSFGETHSVRPPKLFSALLSPPCATSLPNVHLR